jgi:hypothetical protein
MQFVTRPAGTPPPKARALGSIPWLLKLVSLWMILWYKETGLRKISLNNSTVSRLRRPLISLKSLLWIHNKDH